MAFTLLFQVLLLAFGIVLSVNLAGEYLIKHDRSSKYVIIRLISKPLLMPLVIGMYVTAVPIIVWLVVFALAFGFIGDVFLMFDYESRFYLLGSGAFLIGHIFYIWDYSLTFGNFADFPWWRLILYIPVLLIFLLYAFPRISGRMRGKEKPVTTVYGAVLLLMALMAIFRLPVLEIFDPRFLLVWGGALLFVLSDAILAVDRYHKKIQYGMIWIMSSYALGQFLIASGLMLLG